MEIVQIPIDEIAPYKRNAKEHPDWQIEQIMQSIQQYGMNDPLAVTGKRNTLVEGHGRLEALKRLGYTEAPCIRLDHLSDKERREYALVHNKLTMNTDFDLDILTDELEGLDFGELELDWGIEGEDEPPEVTEDDYDPEPPAEPKAKPGDIYQLGRHFLMCGDSTSAEDVARLMDGAKADLLLTDPPYGVNIVKGNTVGGGGPTHFGKVCGKNIVPASTYLEIKGDETTETARRAYDVAKDFSENQVIFGGNYFTDFLPPKGCWIVWDKQNTGDFADVELAWTSFDSGARLYQWLWNGLCRKGERAVEGVSRVHPTQKPVGLMGEILKDFTESGDNVLDLFGGSGSVLIACEQLDRQCFMMEYEASYIDVIIDRWEQFTGEKAVKIEG